MTRIPKIVGMLGFDVTDSVESGMRKTIDWYVSRASSGNDT